MKINVKVKCKTVRYWDIVFENYNGLELTYCCVAPNYALALKSFDDFMSGAKYKLISCSTDGKVYEIH